MIDGTLDEVTSLVTWSVVGLYVWDALTLRRYDTVKYEHESLRMSRETGEQMLALVICTRVWTPSRVLSSFEQ